MVFPPQFLDDFSWAQIGASILFAGGILWGTFKAIVDIQDALEKAPQTISFFERLIRAIGNFLRQKLVSILFVTLSFLLLISVANQQRQIRDLQQKIDRALETIDRIFAQLDLNVFRRTAGDPGAKDIVLIKNPNKIVINSGQGIDGMRINGKSGAGTSGGGKQDEQTLDPNDYWTNVTIFTGGNCTCYIELTSKDGKHLNAGFTNKDKCPTEFRLDNVKIVRLGAVGGHCAIWPQVPEMVSAISFEYLRLPADGSKSSF